MTHMTNDAWPPPYSRVPEITTIGLIFIVIGVLGWIAYHQWEGVQRGKLILQQQTLELDRQQEVLNRQQIQIDMLKFTQAMVHARCKEVN